MKCIVKTTAKNAAGEILYKPDIQTIDCSDSSIDIPNTGSFLKKTDISHADFLTTGLIAFVIFAAFAIIYIVKRRPKARAYATARRHVSRTAIRRTNSASKKLAHKTIVKATAKKSPARKSTSVKTTAKSPAKTSAKSRSKK